MKKFNLCIVEDCESDAKKLIAAIKRYESLHKDYYYEIKTFTSAVSFLDKYTPCDVVFMDIEMPAMDGMKACKSLRETDKNVAIIFVTNMAQYAIDGYSVNAFDFVVKPFNYNSFSIRFDRLMDNLMSKKGKLMEIKVNNTTFNLELADVKYVDIYNYRLIYHTLDKDIEVTTKSLQEVEPYLIKNGFFKCSRSLIVNLRHVKEVEDLEITVGGDKLILARRRKKEFMQALTEFYGNFDM